LYKLRITLGDPTEREERRLGIAVGKKLQDTIDVAFNATFELVPVAPPDMRKKSLDLKVVLDIDGHGVACRAPLHDHRAPSPIGNRIMFNCSHIQKRVSKSNAR